METFYEVQAAFKPLSEIIYEPCMIIAKATGIDLEGVIALVTIFLQFFACLILGQIQSVPNRKVYSTCFGVFLGFFFYGLLFFFNVVLIFVCYAFLALFPRRTASLMIATTAALCTMSISFYQYNVADMQTGSLIDLVFMINFVKLHMFAVNYDNAARIDDTITGKDLTKRERYFAETLKGEIVGLYEWCQYFFFAGSSWTGLITEYRHFDEYMNRKEGFAKIPANKLWLPAFKRFGHMLLMLVFMLVLSEFVSIKVVTTQEWADMHLVVRSLYIIGIVWVKLSKLMVGFIAMEANMIASGHGYSPATNEEPENFNSLRGIYVERIFRFTSWKDVVAGWNVPVHNWLKYYVMMRLMDRSKPPGQTQIVPLIASFLVSAGWHGICWPFFKAFFLIALVDFLIRTMDRTQLAHFIYKNVPFVVYNPIRWYFLQFTNSYVIMEFILNDSVKQVFVHSNLFWLIHWVVLVGLVIAIALPKVRRLKLGESGGTDPTKSPTTVTSSTSIKKKKEQ